TTVKHAHKNAADRKSAWPTVREVLQAPACQPTMTRAPASKEESSNFRAVESLSPRTIAAGRRTPQAPGPGRCHRGREPPSVGEVSPHLPSARRRAAPRRLAGGTPTLY